MLVLFSTSQLIQKPLCKIILAHPILTTYTQVCNSDLPNSFFSFSPPPPEICSFWSLLHLSWWQSSFQVAQVKRFGVILDIHVFLVFSHPKGQWFLLVLPSKHTQNSPTFLHLHCHHLKWANGKSSSLSCQSEESHIFQEEAYQEQTYLSNPASTLFIVWKQPVQKVPSGWM